MSYMRLTKEGRYQIRGMLKTEVTIRRTATFRL